MQRVASSILGWGTKIPHASQTKKKKQNTKHKTKAILHQIQYTKSGSHQKKYFKKTFE